MQVGDSRGLVRAAALAGALLCAAALVAPERSSAAAGAPAILVGLTPAPTTTAQEATIRWTVSTAARSRCRLDQQRQRDCHSPFHVEGLSTGRHTLRIAAVARGATSVRTIGWRVASGHGTSGGPPSASTGGATLRSPTVARLVASVNPAGRATTARFEFGRTAALGHITPNRRLGSGTSATRLADSITALRAGSTYYYRVVAENGSGTTIGTTRSIVVPSHVQPAVPAVATVAVAPSVQAEPVTIGGGLVAHASVDPQGLDTLVWAEYGDDTSYGHATAPAMLAGSAGPTSLPVGLPALAPGTYHLRVVAQNTGGTTYGLDVTFTVPAPPIGAALPSVATGGASGGASGWSVGATVDPHGGPTTVWAEYGTSTSYGSRSATSTLAASASAGPVSLPLGGLQSGTTYHYRVVARSATGTAYGADATFATATPASAFVAPGGDDSADGSIAHPWRTLQKAADSAPAGTTVYLRAGTYAGFTMTRSGTPGAPITFAGYPGETAVLGPASGTNTVDINGAHDVVLRDLTIQGATGQYNAGVMIRNGASDITVTGSTLEHNHSYGLRAYNDTNVTVTDNLITANDTGVRIDFSGAGTVIADNQIVDNQGMVVNDPTPGNDTGANAIVFYKSTGAISVTGNTIHGNRAPSDDYGWDGGAFEIFGASNVTMAENLVFDNQNVVETGTDASHTPCANNVFVHNVAYGGNDKSLVSAFGPVANGLLLRCAQNMLVAQNTFADLDFWTYDISQSSSYSGSVDGLRIVDNINLQHADKVYALEFALPPSVVIDANVDLNEGGGTLASVAGHGTTSSIGDLRAWAGVDTHGIYADPQVVDEAARDFHLLPGSPAIDLGIVIPGVTDGFGGAAPDAGRFESP